MRLLGRALPELDQSLQAGLARRSESCLPSFGDNLALLGIHHILCQMPKRQKPFVGIFHAFVNLENLVRADVHAMHTLDTSFWIRQPRIGVKSLRRALGLAIAAHTAFLCNAYRMRPPSFGTFLLILQ